MRSHRLGWTSWLAVAALLALSLLPPPAAAQENPLDACRLGAFSTEEDFMMQQGEPFDGNPYISDGDVLSLHGQVCARNAQLLAAFFAAAPGPDLGLDALEIIDFPQRVIAFSTEISHPGGAFTAGDLLFTPGYAIPNIALVAPFGINYDIGLDGVQFVVLPGAPGDAPLRFVAALANISRDEFLRNPLLLQTYLKEFGLDIWFSIEGTHVGQQGARILDGDLLSAASGVVVASQAALLPGDVPAGLPARGVDFGLDAVALSRQGSPEEVVKELLFSTEILYDTPERSFTDGDVLKYGDGVQITNPFLVAPFAPAADFLGLDALWLPSNQPPPADPNIQFMCGDYAAADFDGGVVLPNGAGTGLYRDNPDALWPAGRPRRPCGYFVPIDGYLPTTGITRFRVAYRDAGTPRPAADTALGVRTKWQLYEWRWFPFPGCYLGPTLSTDADGWMDAADFIAARNGTLTGCANSGLKLAVWNTDNIGGYEPGPANENGHYVLWLEWEASGTLYQEAFEHHLQLDNTLPVINDLLVTLQDGTTPVGACGDAPNGNAIFKVYADFSDAYYWNYLIQVRGGNPPASISYGWHSYYDGTPPVANTNLTGTTPPATTVFLRDINMADLGASFTDCCYVLDLYVRDAAIRHSFNGRVANDVSGSSSWWANRWFTFSAAP